jgi:hypothetical protein
MADGDRSTGALDALAAAPHEPRMTSVVASTSWRVRFVGGARSASAWSNSVTAR